IADAASAEVDDRVLPLLDRLEQEPDGSVLSDMLHTQPPDGEKLSKAEVRAHPELLDGAVEEALRWHSPVGTQTRQVTERTDIAGVTLEPGTVIAAVLASANQDERHWQQPERFDIHRTGAHAAFGLGAHHCAGAALARHEVRLPL